MSLYGALFGEAEYADLLLAAAGLTRASVGRFRDVSLEKHGDEVLVAVYTRNGGGNRECSSEYGVTCDGYCTGCMAEKVLPSLPNYVRDEDDEFDCTYATFWFQPLDGLPSVLVPLVGEPVDRDAAWQALIEALQVGTR